MFETINLQEMFVTYGLPWLINIALAIVTVIVGRIVAVALVKLLRRGMARAEVDIMLINFVASITMGLLMLVVVVAALDQLSVDTTSFVALIGAAGLAVGFALKDSLGNFSAGVMLIVFKPFKNGDYVEAGGVAGMVEEIRIFSTVLRTPDNREITLPNGTIYSGTITNYSAHATRRIDLVFGIDYGDDIKRARDIMLQVLHDDERILHDPAPVVMVSELADSSVNFVVRPWVNSPDYWNVRADVIEKIKYAFDTNGITIPFPQRDVHYHPTAA